ncbi:MAG: TIGR03619 family F420-dependent LLM class oxidoreductase [Alphaproteobacteria bacterium]|nr:TIGR03619 family F420-dependent LLM class oxidoreductase [Alphaproteobacteria bacterium]
MDFGLHLGTRGAAAQMDGLRALAQRADALGFAYLGISDHIIIAHSIDSKYPYSDSGDWPGIDTGDCLDQLTCLTYAAAVTEKIRLLTSVMVIPHRPAIQTAKQLATADFLSKGRVTAGVGVGWMREELALLSAPPFERRGAASNEYIEAFRTLWTKKTPRYEGEFVSFDNVSFEPKPTQAGGPPIWIGGEGMAARRRTARLGDGWYPVLRNPRHMMDTPERFAAALADIHGFAEEAGRDPAKIDTAMFAPTYKLGAADTSADRWAFSGSAEQIAEDARAFADAGLNHVLIGFEDSDLQRSLDTIEEFAKEVMPLVG